MSSPQAVFLNAAESKRMTLQAVWPELYDALSGRNADGGLPNPGCVIGECAYIKPRTLVPAVGRLTYNGHPACEVHIARMADRPGGWPLVRQEGPKPT